MQRDNVLSFNRKICDSDILQKSGLHTLNQHNKEYKIDATDIKKIASSNQSYTNVNPLHQTLYNAKTHKFVANNGKLSCINKDDILTFQTPKGGAMPLSKSPKK